MNYGKAVRVVRAARGLSQADLAQKAGVDPSYVSLVESGNRVPKVDALERLAEALHVPMYLLMPLGSGPDELRDVPEDVAGELGRRLLDAIVGHKDDE